jgi:hypothetical protein
MASRLSQLATLLAARLADSTVTWSTGQLALRENLGTRRVALVPTKAQHTHRHPVGGKIVGGSPQTRQPAFLTRTLNVDFYIWDGTPSTGLTADRYEATEELLHDLLAAMRLELRADVRFLGEDWKTQDLSGAGYDVNAELCILHTSIDIPVVWESRALTSLETQRFTAIHVAEDGDEEQQYPEP